MTKNTDKATRKNPYKAAKSELIPQTMIGVVVDDDGKISREDWRGLAISRYADVERYRNHADKLAQALSHLLARPEDASEYQKAEAALAAYEEARQ